MSVATNQHPTQVSEIPVNDPRTGALLYTVQEPSDAEIKATFDRARTAYEVIRRMTVRERVAEMLKLKRYILKNRERIIDRVVSENGKSRTDALLTEIFSTLDTMDYYAKHAEKILADAKVPTPLILFPKKSKIIYEPIGPVLIISPWNYPFNLAFTPFICAFLAGNSVIYKPSEWTPLKGLVEEIVEGSGFMKDALQAIYGGKQTGARCIDERPAKICFTGSCRGGRQVMAHAAQYLIPVELELGGKDPMIVFDDVDIERTVNGAIWGGFVNSGQTCTAVERVFVHEKIYDEFVADLRKRIANIRTCANAIADDREHEMGCMTAKFQVNIVADQVADALGKGAQLIVGKEVVSGSHVIEPTVLGNVTSDMKIYSEETFGPVITLHKFSDEDAVIEEANNTVYGLSASVWSRDLTRAERVARRLVTGNVSINNVMATQGNSALPFGGTKDSGFGRYKGAMGLHSFSNPKSILIDKQANHLEVNWYPYSKEKYELVSKLLDAVYGLGGIAGLIKMAPLGMKLDKLIKKHRL